MKSPKGRGKPAVDEDSGIATQENASHRAHSSRQANKQQVRHRASVACASCRDRRIRCVVPKGESECVQCKKAGNECIIRNDDERRRPISKAYMSSLSDRISMLEGMLLEKGVEPPPATHPPKTRHENQPNPPEEEQKRNGMQSKPHKSLVHPFRTDVPSPPDSVNDEYAMQFSDRADSAHADGPVPANFVSQPLPKEQSPFRKLDSKHEDIVQRLLSTKGNLSFDQLSGRLRFFGPTANSHVYAGTSYKFDSREPPEQVRRAERIIRSLSIGTHDYLMENFWAHYNSVLNIIHQDAFEADKESQNPTFYSSFLHICILAIAFRFVDADREDMKRIALGNRESTLHREAKYMLDIELERPGGIPSVQALLLLGDLECGVGRDNTGWMYAGMANRLAFDIGLHLDCRSNDISEQEVDIRHMVMRACVIYDRYWALFLGRPTSIKNQDIEMDLLSRRFSQLTSLMSGPGALKKNITADIYDHLIELMELAGRIVETRDHGQAQEKQREDATDNALNPPQSEYNAYLHAINLDRQLQNWYRRLPEHLQWKPSVIKSAPSSYFLLHQQYHASMILLHRPWARYSEIVGDSHSTASQPTKTSGRESRNVQSQHSSPSSSQTRGINDKNSIADESRTALSRNICTQQAVRVARIFGQHRQRFDGTKIFVTGIQQAGTAAMALIAALAYNHSEFERRAYLGYLEILSSAVSDMSHTYQPASRMDDLLKAVLVQLRADIGGHGIKRESPITSTGGDQSVCASSEWKRGVGTTCPTLPARREADTESSQIHKRRRPSKSSRRSSEFTRRPPPFFSAYSQPTLLRTSQGQPSTSHLPPLDPAMYSIDGNDVQSFKLDFLDGSAIDNDPEETSEATIQPAEDFVLVASESDGWTFSRVATEEAIQQRSLGYDKVNLNGWRIATTGTHAASALGRSHSFSSVLQHNERGEDRTKGDESTAPRGLFSDQLAQQLSELSDTVKEDAATSIAPNSSGPGDMDWMCDSSGLNALSPVSLSGLVQEAIPDKGESESAGTHRNHELDFFSF
ncbi:fungal specific transcription factor [Colletotrichum truncatum]|uniref:Fungal specific transcription factor n=1 Tax=Colletotrichum truncatum TaxID=5467 RepID=A0ACC3YS67_COLTU